MKMRVRQLLIVLATLALFSSSLLAEPTPPPSEVLPHATPSSVEAAAGAPGVSTPAAPSSPTPPPADLAIEEAPAVTQRSVTRRGYLTLRSFSPATTRAAVIERLEALGAFVQSSDDETLEWRVPIDAFDEVWQHIRKLDEVVQQDIQTTDVTLERLSLRGKIDVLEKSRRRIKGMLAHVTTVSASLEIEQSLADTTRQLEAAEGRLRFLEQRLQLVPLTLRISMKARPNAERQRPSHNPFPWVEDYGLQTLLH